MGSSNRLKMGRKLESMEKACQRIRACAYWIADRTGESFTPVDGELIAIVRLAMTLEERVTGLRDYIDVPRELR